MKTPPRLPSVLPVCCALALATPGPALADGGSAAAREDSFVSILALPVGFVPRYVSGASISFNVVPAFVAEGFYEYGAYKVGGTRSRRERAGGRALLFPGNSFFLSLGAAFDKTSDRERDHAAVFSALPSENEWRGSYEQIEAEVGLGNRWQWDSGFTLSATWAGFSRGVHKIHSSSNHYGLTDATVRGHEDDLEDSAESGGVHFAKIALGISF